jgi:nitroreductase
MPGSQAGARPTPAPDPGRPDVPVGADAPILAVMASMQAMRRLRPDPVPDELLRRLVEAAMWAPSAAAVEGQVFVVVTDRATIARLAEVWRTVSTFYEQVIAPAIAGWGSDPVVERSWDAIRNQREHFHETPAVIVACYDQRAHDRRARARRRAFAAGLRSIGPRRALTVLRQLGATSDRVEAASIYPAVQNLLLAARTLGLGANISGWHLFLEPEVKAILGIPADVRTYAVIPVGWPAGRFGLVRRRDVDTALRVDHW